MNDGGRIPFRVRIGAVGHRRLDDEAFIAGQVQEAVRMIRERIPASEATPVRLSVVSALAEGADRLIAREVLSDEGAALEAILPLPRSDYENDFQTAESRDEFRSLLETATSVTEGGPQDEREAGYEKAGIRVVERSDVVIAIWDGSPARGRAGTAMVVEYARRHQVPVVWIRTGGSGGITQDWTGLDSWLESIHTPLDRFNKRDIGGSTAPAPDEASLRRLADWIMPVFNRADVLATRYQRRYQVLGNIVFLTAAGAVITAAAQSLFDPGRPGLVWIEVGLMVGLLLLVFMGRRGRIHESWISYRFLAERFRSAMFLALSGIAVRTGESNDPSELRHPSEEWVRRAFAEVWFERPIVPPPGDIPALKRVMVDAWINDQIGYHTRKAAMHARRNRILSHATDALFGLTIVAALFHALRIGAGQSDGLQWDRIFIFLSGSLPALAAALGGIRAQGEHMRHAERYERMAHYLGRARDKMSEARDLATIQSVAAESESIMLEENRDWFMVMRFHDFELQV